MNKETKIQFWHIFIGIVIILFSILMLFAISGNILYLVKDYRILQNSELSFFRIIKLDFPLLSNPIGPFGVFFGFWIVYIFGKFFSISLLLGTALLGFFSIFLRTEKHPFQKTICFIVFAFFFNLILFILRPESQLNAGLIPWEFFQFLIRIFDYTGTLIISLALVIVCLLFIFEVDNVTKFFKFIFKASYSFLKFVFKKEPNKIVKLKKEKKIFPKKIKIIDDEKKPLTIPNITDHVLSNKKKETEIKKTKPEKFVRKLSQDKKDMPDEPLRKYVIPDIEDFLTSTQSTKRDREEIEANIKHVSEILVQKLAEFNVEAEVKNVNIGPIITQYEIEPAPGVKVNKFHALADDLSLAIKATSIRVQAPIPGRGLVGIEIPNVYRDTIYLKDVMLSAEMKAIKSKLVFGLGKDIAGKPFVADLSLMPHLLIAGATGSGKSVCVNSLICSLLFRVTPEEVRFILIDPKRIELSVYEGIPHLIQNVVTNNEDALIALDWSVAEMDKRYDLFQKYKVKSLNAYNKEITKLRKKDGSIEEDTLPFIVIIVDELADLMMTVGREVERPITRLAQMARAIGIHLVLATQRPSIKVITGIIKANFPSRIAFQVSSKIDSRVIIDANGAEKLLGLGDSLYLPPGSGKTERIHGAFIKPSEIHDLIDYLKTQPKPEKEITIISETQSEIGDFDYDDELFPEAAVAVVTAGTASVSMLQRHFKIGYARAGRLIDMMEKAGIIGPHVGSKSREVLSTEEDMKIYGFIPD
ncbi:MAG: cell division protein FtsK [Candidatus Cloacimonetes bacterium]|nr:cell division protein FtsK [Candidatus Cloacimonadota bacterium]